MLKGGAINVTWVQPQFWQLIQVDANPMHPHERDVLAHD